MDKSAKLFTASGPSVFTMPSGANFLHCLAKGLRDSLGGDLHTALILLPTRRAVRELTEAFLNLYGGKPLLMPLMRPLADMDENEPPFEPGEIALSVKPAIEDTRRRFALARLTNQLVYCSHSYSSTIPKVTNTQQTVSAMA